MGYDAGHDVGKYTGRYRVTVQEASERLGVKEGAIRKRIERGTIRSDKDIESGRVYVYVDEPPAEDAADAGHDNRYDASYPTGYDMLLRSQQDQIDFLRRELERKDAILLNMTEGLKSLEAAPQSSPEGRVSPSEDDGGGRQDQSGDTGHPRAPWWKRLLGIPNPS